MLAVCVYMGGGPALMYTAEALSLGHHGCRQRAHRSLTQRPCPRPAAARQTPPNTPASPLLPRGPTTPTSPHEQAVEIIRGGRGSRTSTPKWSMPSRPCPRSSGASPSNLPMPNPRRTARSGPPGRRSAHGTHRTDFARRAALVAVPCAGASSAVTVPVQGGGRGAVPVQPQLGQQLHIGIHIGVARHQQLVAVKIELARP